MSEQSLKKTKWKKTLILQQASYFLQNLPVNFLDRKVVITAEEHAVTWTWTSLTWIIFTQTRYFEC